MISFLVSVVKDFAELVSDKYKAMMMKLSLQITGSREDAEEAVQDALLSVHRNQRKITDIQPDIDAFKDEYGFSEEVADALKLLSNEDRDLICYY